MGFGKTRVAADGVAVGAYRLIELPEGLQGIAQAAAVERDLRFDLSCTPNRLDSDPMLPDLMSDQAKQMQGIRLAWVNFQHLNVERLRLRELASALVPKTHLQNAA